ncbi:ovochymase-2-like [Culicoides brevitarsis]|uniref:ovochymase-2-like n=1 Tax=Culicoides brevitarsis TaxID=469753 RepID=UPI00307B7B4B
MLRAFCILYLVIPVFCKIYEKCELIEELTEVHKLNVEVASKLACIAEVSRYNTSKKSLEFTSEDSFGFKNYILKYGIFRFSAEYWCSETSPNGGICHINCKKFLDDDITDDLACVMQIQKNLAIYNSWGYDWPGGVKRACSWRQNLQSCAELSKDDWKSSADCLLKYPEMPKAVWKNEGQNGVKALKHEFPHAAALGWTRDGEITWGCGGSLIADDTILTAAHCTWNSDREPPDIVRLGDLNLLTDDDEKETQQFEIKAIIRHPSYKPRYNDIALVKLKSKVNITKFVIPACLWPTHKIPEKISLEACGFGKTEYAGDMSPILNKVTLRYLDTISCQESYQGIRLLKEGLKEETHLCANDPTGRNQDMCEGDSGSPLEMKLHLEDKIVPFIVGITAFGKLCGSEGSPGVYTRVSSFIEWIRYYTPNLPATSLECAVQYKDKRTIDPNFNRPRVSERDDFVNKVIKDEYPKAAESVSAIGVIISNRYILTSAQKLNEMSSPNRVLLEQSTPIERVIFHPNFSIQTPQQDDIAIIRLRQRISWTKTQFPLCLPSTPLINDFVLIEQTSFDLTRQHQLYRVSRMEACRQAYSEFLDFHNIDENKILCLLPTIEVRYVPDSCKIPIGTSIYTKINHNGASVMMLHGMVVFSKDCGPVIATKISSYTEWIEQVVFKK